MSSRQSLYQSVAVSGAVLVVFIGVCHEVVGPRLFPWGPDLFGGAIGWHAAGLGCIAIGLALLGGTLRFVRFPVIPSASIVGAAGLAAMVFTAVAHQEFHLFALTLALASASTAFFHRAASQISAAQGSD